MPKVWEVKVFDHLIQVTQDDDGSFFIPEGLRGLGGALKPAFEPILLCRKPLEGTVAQNVLQYGTGAMNIDGCRVPGEPVPINKLEAWSGFGQRVRPEYTPTVNTEGRWPANLVLSYPEDQYELREDITEEQRSELYSWLAGHADQ